LPIERWSGSVDAVAEVKSRLNIEDVIGEYVQLKRTGRNFKGLSPWTNERTPSFIVSPEKQIWHDFSSGKGGDMFSFVMEVEGLDFKAALETLARKAGVDLEQFGGQHGNGASKRKARALEALELATKFYQKQLVANKRALQYLRNQRSYSKQTILNWRFGYSPNTSSALTEYLTKHGFTADEMRAAGLVTMRRDGAADMFRGRIMIPLCDSRGEVIGFTARLLDQEADSPKYINTPSSAVYDKSRHVFGLHHAKEAIRKSGFVVVAEGNLDVVTSHQASVANVVASAGTAMTEQHLKALKRFTGDIRLSFDADSAGINATERVIPLAQKSGVSLSIINLQSGKDPDELIKSDVEAWQKAVDSASYAPDWLIEHYQDQLDMKTAQGKKAFTDALLTTVRRLQDPVEQEHYLKLIAQLTDTSFEAVSSKMKAGSDSLQTVGKKLKPGLKPVSRSEGETQKLQDHFLSMILMRPELRYLLEDTRPDFFAEGPPRVLVEFLKKNPEFKGEGESLPALRDIGDYVKIVSLQFEELYQGYPVQDLEEQANILKRRLIERYVKNQNHELAEAIKNASDERSRNELIKKAKAMNELINQPSKPRSPE
jgi:DNA primase